MEKQQLLNTYVNNLSKKEALRKIEAMVSRREKAFVVPINVDVVMKAEKDPYLKTIIDQAELVLIDGKPLIWISKLYGRPIKEKLSGSDLVPALCRDAAKKGWTVFILGGGPGIADHAAKNLMKKYPELKIVGTYAPKMGFEHDKEELEYINQTVSAVHPDILIACFGCPKQEKFIYENYRRYDAAVSICGGATVDFLAGSVRRAPKWMSDHGLEWFYRFLQEPKRLFKRYFIDDVKIVFLVWKYRNQRVKGGNKK